jgi:hypothetical protein
MIILSQYPLIDTENLFSLFGLENQYSQRRESDGDGMIPSVRGLFFGPDPSHISRTASPVLCSIAVQDFTPK